MKTTLSLLALIASFTPARAQDACYGTSDYGTTVSYATPVVYQSPVIYQAPVTYYAPVFYLASAASAALYVSTERSCSSPSTVIHITGGRGTYVTSNCEYSDSSVVVIGSRYARGNQRNWRGHTRLGASQFFGRW
ncbi:MAG: hypothetical protein H7Y43_11895 [Akkermansiaceae bacterium]|nr:hypothetical protein [Verrucomicrobiales bacterium]